MKKKTTTKILQQCIIMGSIVILLSYHRPGQYICNRQPHENWAELSWIGMECFACQIEYSSSSLPVVVVFFVCYFCSSSQQQMSWYRLCCACYSVFLSQKSYAFRMDAMFNVYGTSRTAREHLICESYYDIMCKEHLEYRIERCIFFVCLFSYKIF